MLLLQRLPRTRLTVRVAAANVVGLGIFVDFCFAPHFFSRRLVRVASANVVGLGNLIFPLFFLLSKSYRNNTGKNFSKVRIS